MAKTVLIVEDERAIVEILKFNLKREGYETMEALDGETGLKLALEGDPDLILLDVMLPKLNGFDICAAIRKAGRVTPVIMLTAREEETDKVFGLEAGADDYITKPFAIEELLARIRAALRRAGPAAGTTAFTTGALTIDYDKHLVTIEGKPVHLTANEYRLVELLSRSAGKVLTYDRISEAMWGDAAGGNSQLLRVNMANIRRKIEETPGQPQYIFTEVGVGYRMREGD